jgi:hypothetical protein
MLNVPLQDTQLGPTIKVIINSETQAVDSFSFIYFYSFQKRKWTNSMK